MMRSDSLIFEVLGNRKPILFVEGERGSYDNQLYPYIYENYSVIPCHNCSKVIEMTKAFNNERVRNLHNYDVKGLIDHDYLTEEEVEKYKSANIFTLSVAEIENLYLLETVIKIVANNQALDPQVTFNKVKDFLFEEFKKEQEFQLVSMCTKEIRHKLQCYKIPKEHTLNALLDQFNEIRSSIDIVQIYQSRKDEIEQILSNKDYDGLLRIYNNKGLHKRISSIYGLSPGEYPNLILRLLKTDRRGEIIGAFKQYVPTI